MLITDLPRRQDWEETLDADLDHEREERQAAARQLLRLLLIVAALSLSACAAPGFYVDGAVSVMDTRYAEVKVTGPQTWEFQTYSGNPLGRIALGYEVDLSTRISAALEVAHQSSIATNRDHGDNFAVARVRWYPFRANH